MVPEIYHFILSFKIKKKTGDSIILHLCTTNDDMMYGSWDIEHDRQKNFEKMKKLQEVLSF